MPGPSCSLSRMVILVSHFCDAEPAQPGTTRRTGPPWMFGSGWPFIAPHDQRVRVHRLLDAHAARDRRRVGIAREVQVGRVVRGVFRAGFKLRVLEHIGKPHAGPLGAACAAVGPLVAARGRREGRAAVAAAFQHHALRHGLVFLLQFAERDGDRIVHLAVDDDLPVLRVFRFVRNLPVVADVEFLRSAWCRRRAGSRASRRRAGDRRARRGLRSCRGISGIAGLSGRRRGRRGSGRRRALRIGGRDQAARRGWRTAFHPRSPRPSRQGLRRREIRGGSTLPYPLAAVTAIQVPDRASGFPRHGFPPRIFRPCR